MEHGKEHGMEATAKAQVFRQTHCPTRRHGRAGKARYNLGV